MFEKKLKASIIHLIISFILVSLVVGSIFFFFFPSLFVGVSDFKEIALILITVDLILGPILTFVVFQPNKKSLKFDLSVIATIQIVALFYGAFSLYQVHPVYVTFNIDRFTLISAKDAEPEKAAYDEFRVSKFTAAKLAYAKMPEDIDKRNELSLTAAMGGGDLDHRVEYYEPYNNHIEDVLSKGIEHELIKEAADKNKKISSFLKKHQNEINNYAFLPITSAKKDGIIVLDKVTAKPIATISADPWLMSEK